MSLSPHIEIRIRTTPIDQSETNETSAFNKMKIAMKLCGNKTENKYWLFYLINFSTTNENRIEQKKTWYKRWNDTDTLKKKIGILLIALLQSFKNVVVLNWLLSKLNRNWVWERIFVLIDYNTLPKIHSLYLNEHSLTCVIWVGRLPKAYYSITKQNRT